MIAAMLAALILLGLVGAAACVVNLQHAHDPLSPLPRREAPRWRTFIALFGAAVVYAASRRFDVGPLNTAGWLALWFATWLTLFGAVKCVGVAIHNGRERRRAAQRWHGGDVHRWVLPLLLLAVTLLAGCAGGGATIRADAVDGSFRRVADRHDKYVTADPALSDLERRIALRDTALLRGVLDEAKRTATTQPAGGK